jgi:3-hydroxypropanoate dehydrogenase
MTSPLPSASLDQLFRLARTYNEWTPRDVEDRTIHELYELLKWGPTSREALHRQLQVRARTWKDC